MTRIIGTYDAQVVAVSMATEVTEKDDVTLLVYFDGLGLSPTQMEIQAFPGELQLRDWVRMKMPRIEKPSEEE